MCHEKKYFLFLILFILFLYTTLPAEKPLRVLILSGSNNHNWQETTPELKKIYESSGRFLADVTNDPSSCTAETFAKYDVLVSNWNAFPQVTGHQWGDDTEKAFVDFVRKGKGFALFHAASATFQDWPEYQQLVGATWEEGVTGHGPQHTFKVSISDRNHPVTKRMKDFFIKDELWHKTRQQPNIHVLCKAFSAQEMRGSGQYEPMVLTTKFGKGRCFYNILGHNVQAMRNIGWQALMLRGTEWAATGKVTIPIPGNWPDSKKKATNMIIDH